MDAVAAGSVLSGFSAGAGVGVAVVIPAYQPGTVLVDLVAALPAALHSVGLGAVPILVVDDGSAPGHAPVFAALAGLPGVHLLRHAINLGKGMALRTGINAALAGFPGLLGVVTADADGQHLPDDIARVAATLCGQPGALILGTRSFDHTTPLRSRFGNLLTRTVFRGFTRAAVADTQTGLRGLPRAVAERVLRIGIAGYELEFESLVVEVRRGTPIVQLPITTVYEPGNPTSHFNPLRDSLKIYFVFLRYSLLAVSAALLDYLLFFAIFSLTGTLLTSVLAGRVLAGWLYFLAARRQVFRVRGDIRRQALLFTLVVAASAIATYGLVTVLLLVFGLPLLAAKLVADLVLFFANFALQRIFVFAQED